MSTSGNTVEFVHNTRLLNAATYSGGVAQIHKRNSSFQLAFTVEDPTNAGFTVGIDQLLRGYSEVTTTSGRGEAKGVSYLVQADDPTDARGTLSNRLDRFLATGGVTVDLDPGGTLGTARGLSTKVSNLTRISSPEALHCGRSVSPPLLFSRGKSQTKWRVR